MRPSLTIGRVLGVEIGLHWSWSVLAVWVTAALAARFGAMYPEYPPAALWASAALTALLFFLSLLAHEMAHAVTAHGFGLPVRSITLFALGGVAQLDRDPPSAGAEFWIALAGPLASAQIGAACLATAWAAGWSPGTTPATPALAIPLWLGYVNLVAAAFNMVPAYPLDGGRVLRALVWYFGRDRHRSLKIAALSGRAAAIGLAAAGVLRFATAGGVESLWLALIGWFLIRASASSYLQLRVAEALRTVRVRDIMARDCPAIDRFTNLREFIEERLAAAACFLVTDRGEVAGVVTAREMRDVPRPQWPYRTVGDVMLPIGEAHTISPDTLALEALETMGRENLQQLAVSNEGRLEGIISRASLLGFLQKSS